MAHPVIGRSLRWRTRWMVLLCLAAGQLLAQSPRPATLVEAGRLLDPRTGNVVSPAAVLIEDGKIKEVGPPARVQADAPAGVKTIDLGGATLLPGLIDSHTHLLVDVIPPAEAEIAVHALTPTSIQTAIDSGADSIEHGNSVTDAQIKTI